MKSLLKTLAVGASLAALGACATNYDVAATKAMSPKGGAFQSALHQEYVGVAQMEYDEADWKDTAFFNGRAQMAAMGQTFGPQEISERRIPDEAMADLKAARFDLIQALAAGAKTNPGPAARAQAMYDCWLQEQEENFQPKDIAWCRAEFEAALGQIAKAPMPMAKKPEPMPVAMPGPYSVPFDFNSSAMNLDAMQVVAKISKAYKSAMPDTVSVTGHTDTSGNVAYNERLALKRAETVKRTLKSTGIPDAKITTNAWGEQHPKAKTGDNVKNAENRRVEVMFIK